MDVQRAWERALKNTEIIRSRVKHLFTFSNTCVPYIFLSESTINIGDTVIRKGEIIVEKPSIILPPNVPQLEGFEFDDQERLSDKDLTNFLLLRGVTLPSLKYNNKTNRLDVFEGKLAKAVDHFKEHLQIKEDIQTGLIVGPEDCWQFSILIFICAQVARNTDIDIRKLVDDYKRRENE